MLRRSRRPLRQSPDHDDEGSTHVRTAFMGLTSSRDVTASGRLTARTSSRPTIFSLRANVVGHVTVVVKVINVSVDIEVVRDSKQYRLAEVPST
jgi:hypothetical protein